MKSIFLDTLNRKNTERPPFWFMRQAGRVLPNYNRLKENYSFRELMSRAELAAEVTLMPVYDLGVDAAILFSDILVIPVAMGMELEFTDKGPVFKTPLKGRPDPADRLAPDPGKLEYIYKVIDEVIRRRPSDIPLIGFCGAPLTTMCYMIEGTSSNQGFPETVRFLFQQKKEAKKLIESIVELAVHYATKQIEHGIDVFQLFETHAGLIPAELYNELFIPSVKRIGQAVRETGTPFIFFPKGLGTGLKYITPEVSDFVSIDWQTPLAHAREIVHPEVGLQGNLDPRILYGSKHSIEKELEKFKSFFRDDNKAWIFNLGHGFMPDTPFENANFVSTWLKGNSWK